jgi:hypothetical protein
MPATWLDRLPHPEVADKAAACLEEMLGPAEAVELLERADGDRRFALWLHLVDHHLADLPTPPTPSSLKWRDAYEAAWSPRDAAFAAWARPASEPGRLEDPDLTCPIRPELSA